MRPLSERSVWIRRMRTCCLPTGWHWAAAAAVALIMACTDLKGASFFREGYIPRDVNCSVSFTARVFYVNILLCFLITSCML